MARSCPEVSKESAVELRLPPGQKKAGLQVKHAANFIAGIYNLTDSDIVILGGSVAIKIEGFVEEVEVLVKSKVYEAQRSFIKVRKSILNEDSGLIGAAYLAFSKEK